MTAIEIPDYKTKCSGITFQTNGCVKVQYFEDISNHESNVL